MLFPCELFNLLCKYNTYNEICNRENSRTGVWKLQLFMPIKILMRNQSRAPRGLRRRRLASVIFITHIFLYVCIVYLSIQCIFAKFALYVTLVLPFFLRDFASFRVVVFFIIFSFGCEILVFLNPFVPGKDLMDEFWKFSLRCELMSC